MSRPLLQTVEIHGLTSAKGLTLNGKKATVISTLIGKGGGNGVCADDR